MCLLDAPLTSAEIKEGFIEINIAKVLVVHIDENNLVIYVVSSVIIINMVV